MSEDQAYTINVAGLDKLVKALKAKLPVARVGVLADKNARGIPSGHESKSLAGNAEIGAVHEFGSPARGIPARSFLRMPLSEKLNEELEKSGMLTEAQTKLVMKQGSIKPWMEVVAKLAEGVVIDAFDTKGFGKWKPWKNPNYSNEGGTLLMDTGQLRDAITSEVKA